MHRPMVSEASPGAAARLETLEGGLAVLKAR